MGNGKTLRTVLYGLGLMAAAATHASPTIVNGGFESPNLGKNVWSYRQTNITAWTLTNQAGAANGGTPWSTHSHSGNQYAFLQSAGSPGRISQTVSGFVPGQTYRIRFWMQNRPGGTGNTVTVLMDNVAVSPAQRSYGGIWIEYASSWFIAQNETQTLSFAAEQTSNDISSAIDDVSIEEFAVTHGTLQNSSFEEPDFGLNRNYDNPLGISLRWSFDSRSGIGSAAPNFMPAGIDGKQYAYLRDNGTLAQESGALDPSKIYVLRFAASQPLNAVAQTIKVSFDTKDILNGFRPDSPYWKETATEPFVANLGFGQLVFKGGTEGGGVSLIDQVRLEEVFSCTLANFTIQRGNLLGGTLTDLAESDDASLNLGPGFVLNGFESPVSFEVSAQTDLRNLDYLCLQVESKASSSNLGQTIELYDVEHARYVKVDSQTLGATDTRRSTIRVDDANSFIDPATGSIKCRISIRAVGPLSNPNWIASFDQVRMSAAPFGGQQ